MVVEVFVLDALQDACDAPGDVVMDPGALAGPPDQAENGERAVGFGVQDVTGGPAGLTAALAGGQDAGVGQVRAELPLPVAGILSEARLEDVIAGSERIVQAAGDLGCMFPAPFQMLAFLALSVIPKLKLTDRGLVDVDRFELVPLHVDG